MIRTHIPNRYSERKFLKGEINMTFIKNHSYFLMSLVLLLFFSFMIIKKMEQEIVYEQIIVSEGDTLWAYSQEYANGMPVEKWIDEMIAINHLSSDKIRAGEKLQIPVSPQKIQYNDIATNLTEEQN